MVQFWNIQQWKGFWKLFNFLCKPTRLGEIKLSRWQILCRTKPSDFMCTFTETQGLGLRPNCVQTSTVPLLQSKSVVIQPKKHRHGMRPNLHLISLDDTNKSHPNPLTLQAQNYVYLSKGVLMFRTHKSKCPEKGIFFPFPVHLA